MTAPGETKKIEQNSHVDFGGDIQPISLALDLPLVLWKNVGAGGAGSERARVDF